MLALLIGDFSILFGLGVLFLPLFITELSRPGDGFVGAAILLFGLVLIANTQSVDSALTLAFIFGTLIVSRLGWEVGLIRWNHLSQDEQQRIGSFERWSTSFKQLTAAMAQLLIVLSDFSKFISPKPKRSKDGKKWIRSEKPIKEESESSEIMAAKHVTASTGNTKDPTEMPLEQKRANNETTHNNLLK